MKTFEEWVNISNEIHNSKYTYKQMFKKNNANYLVINCEKHGDFEKKISNHTTKKQGCPSCSYCKSSKILSNTKECFIEKAIQIHGDKYDYSLVEYNGSQNNVKIICKTHGIFEQTPSNHYKQNCPKCSKISKYTLETFIEKANKIHNLKYEYLNITFIDCNTPVQILCKEHGYFLQKPRDHINGNGCYKCCGKIKNTTDFIEKASMRHNNLYDYSKSLYKNAKDKISITCKVHGDFLQSPNDHLNGCGCQKCGLGNFSKKSIEWLNNIMFKEKIFIQHAENNGEKIIEINNKKYKCDGYCEETNTIYEFYGDIWHGNPDKFSRDGINPLNKKTFGELYDDTITRENILKERGYKLITIWESEYNI
jgi:hypothetical protein